MHRHKLQLEHLEHLLHERKFCYFCFLKHSPYDCHCKPNKFSHKCLLWSRSRSNVRLCQFRVHEMFGRPKLARSEHSQFGFDNSQFCSYLTHGSCLIYQTFCDIWAPIFSQIEMDIRLWSMVRIFSIKGIFSVINKRKKNPEPIGLVSTLHCVGYT